MTVFTSTAEAQQTGLYELPASTGEVVGAAATDALYYSPLWSIMRGYVFEEANRGAPVIPLDKQQRMFDEAGVKLKPQQMMTEAATQLLIDRAIEREQRAATQSRATAGQTALGFGAGFLASAVDPINIASGFIPVIGPTRYASLLASQASRTGRMLLRARVGAAAGAVGATLTEPFVYAQAVREQADYDMTDLLINAAFGAGLGGGLHMGAGAIGDFIKARGMRSGGVNNPSQIPSEPQSAKAAAFDRLPPQVKEQIFRANLAAVVQDRMPNVDFEPSAAARQAGTFDPATYQPPRATTAIELGQEAGPVSVKISVEDGKVEMNGAEVPRRVADVARKNEPQLWARFDEVSGRVESYRKFLDDLGDGTPREKTVAELKDAEAKVDQLRATIKATTDKRKLKRLNRQLDDAILEYNDTKSKALEGADLKQVRSSLVKEEAKLRDMAEEITASTRRAEADITERPFDPAPAPDVEPPPVVRVEDVQMQREPFVKGYDPESLLLFDDYALRAIDDAYVTVDEVADLPEAEALRDEAVEMLKETQTRLGIDDEIKLELDEDMQLAEGEAIAFREMASCQFGR